jgi:drug/metabolite transporter (DMT)-like permease
VSGAEPPRRALPFLAFALCTAIWGSTFLFIRIGNDTLAPVWASALRLGLASVLLTGIAFATRRPWPRGGALAGAAMFGFVDFGVSLPLLYWAEKVVPSAIAAIVYAMLPLMTALLAHAVGLERVSMRKVVAGVVGLAGVALLVSGEIAGSTPAVPMVAVVLAAATASLAGIVLKRAPASDPVTTNAVAHATGFPFCLGASLFLGESRALPADAAGWLPLLYLTIVGSIVAFVTFTWLVRHWSVVRISFIAIITPVIATVLGTTVRHERLGPAAAAGALVVFGAVALAIASDAKRRPVSG